MKGAGSASGLVGSVTLPQCPLQLAWNNCIPPFPKLFFFFFKFKGKTCFSEVKILYKKIHGVIMSWSLRGTLPQLGLLTHTNPSPLVSPKETRTAPPLLALLGGRNLELSWATLEHCSGCRQQGHSDFPKVVESWGGSREHIVTGSFLNVLQPRLKFKALSSRWN